MTKIKITEQQYKALLLQQEKKRLNENTNNVLLVIASLAGVNLTGHNKVISDNSKQDSNLLLKVKSTLENKDKLNDLIAAFEAKGLKNPKNFLAKNADKIRTNFNEISNDAKLDFVNQSILKELGSE